MLKLWELSVEKIKIDDDAGHIFDTLLTAGTIGFTYNWVTIQTVTITSDGGLINIFGSTELRRIVVTGITVRIGIFNNAGLLINEIPEEYFPDLNVWLPRSITAVDWPGSGEFTYTLRAITDGSSGSNIYEARNRALVLQESRGK